MNNLVTRMLSFGMVLAGVVSLHAQTATVNVPFNFYAGGVAMPQGVYNVAELMNGSAISLHTANMTKFVAVTTVSARSAQDRPRLVFRRYGDTYFLAQIWPARATYGHATIRAALEKELSAKLATPAETVVVALAQ
jgi:hypothetical protein